MDAALGFDMDLLTKAQFLDFSTVIIWGQTILTLIELLD